METQRFLQTLFSEFHDLLYPAAAASHDQDAAGQGAYVEAGFAGGFIRFVEQRAVYRIDGDLFGLRRAYAQDAVLIVRLEVGGRRREAGCAKPEGYLYFVCADDTAVAQEQFYIREFRFVIAGAHLFVYRRPARFRSGSRGTPGAARVRTWR